MVGFNKQQILDTMYKISSSQKSQNSSREITKRLLRTSKEQLKISLEIKNEPRTNSN